MSVLYSKTKDGGDCLSVQPDADTAYTVADLVERGHTDIRDAETGERYTKEAK